jgi:hypothetical protein
MQTPAQSTLILARIIGPLLVAMGLAVVIRPSVFIGVVDSFAADAVTPLMWGFVGLLLGLVVLAFHRLWNTWTEIAITVIGVISVVRGLILLFIPTQAVAVARDLLGTAPFVVMLAAVLAAVLGGWLAYVGYGDEIPQRKPADVDPAIDPELHNRTT